MNFATVNFDENGKFTRDEKHVVNVKYPLDQYSSDLLENISFYKSFIHDFRVETSDKTISLNDIFVSIVPIGSIVQNITVRYLELPERATVGLELLPKEIESIHIISSMISNDDIINASSILDKNSDLSIRLTGLFKDKPTIEKSYIKVGNDHIIFSRDIIPTEMKESEEILDENDAIQYVFDIAKNIEKI